MGGARFIQGDLLERAMASSKNTRSSSAMDTLTERERRVVEEISRGLRNSEIAQRLDVTEGTIKVYLHKIYTKLGVKSRTELALMARDGPSPSAAAAASGSRSSRVRSCRSPGRLAFSTSATGVSAERPAPISCVDISPAAALPI